MTTARATIPEQFNAFLAEPRTAVMCLGRGPERAPHATPVWYSYRDGRFEISITRTRAKYRYLERSPETTLVIDDPMGYRTVIVEGRCRIADDDASLLSLAKRLRAKYRAGSPSPADDEILRGLHAEERVVVILEPEKVISWAR